MVDGERIITTDAKGVSGGRWVTMRGRKVLIKGGKFVNGPLAGKTYIPNGSVPWKETKYSYGTMYEKTLPNGAELTIDPMASLPGQYAIQFKVNTKTGKAIESGMKFKNLKEAKNAMRKLENVLSNAKSQNQLEALAKSTKENLTRAEVMVPARKQVEELGNAYYKTKNLGYFNKAQDILEKANENLSKLGVRTAKKMSPLGAQGKVKGTEKHSVIESIKLTSKINKEFKRNSNDIFNTNSARRKRVEEFINKKLPFGSTLIIREDKPRGKILGKFIKHYNPDKKASDLQVMMTNASSKAKVKPIVDMRSEIGKYFGLRNGASDFYEKTPIKFEVQI